MKKIGHYLATIGLILASSCTSPDEWHDPKDNTAPGAVSGVQVENLNGGARISYTLPADKDLLGAKVTYSLTKGGAILEKYASGGVNSIELEGFGNTDEYTVAVYAVDKSGNISAPVETTIKPLVAPIILMRESLEAASTFGGISLLWDNPLGKDMGISLYIADSVNGGFKLYDTYFSNSKTGKTVFRPFDTEEQVFHIEMFDRWKNYASPMETALTPLLEYNLPGRNSSTDHIWTLFDDDNHLFRGDIHNDMSSSTYSVRPFALVHDGNAPSNANNAWWNPGNDNDALEKYIPGAGNAALPYPLYFTVDMGKEAVYSRFNIKSRLRTPVYSANLPIDFEIWGTNTPKLTTEVGDGSREDNLAYWTSWEAANGTDAWKTDGWVKLSDCKLVLSSGESHYVAGMALSDEDTRRYNSIGFDFDMTEGVTDGYRYLRWVIKDINNTTARNLQICEIAFWGSYVGE